MTIFTRVLPLVIFKHCISQGRCEFIEFCWIILVNLCKIIFCIITPACKREVDINSSPQFFMQCFNNKINDFHIDGESRFPRQVLNDLKKALRHSKTVTMDSCFLFIFVFHSANDTRCTNKNQQFLDTILPLWYIVLIAQVIQKAQYKGVGINDKRWQYFAKRIQ